MSFFSIVMIITILVLVTSPHTGPMASIQSFYNTPQRLQDVLSTDKIGHLGGIVDEFQPYMQSDDSIMQSDTLAVVHTVPMTPFEPEPASEIDGNNHALANVYQNEEDPSFLQAVLRFGWISYIVGLLALLPLHITISLTQTVVFSGIAAILGGALFVVFNFWRDLQTADMELMGFAQDIQTKRASILQRLNMASLIVDKGLGNIATHVQMEQERVHDDLASFRPGDSISLEVGAFREKLESWLQNEFDQQVSSMKDFLHDLKQTRHGNPNLAKIKAQQERLDVILQQTNGMDGSNSRYTTSSTDEGPSSTCPTSSDGGTSHGHDKTGYKKKHHNTEDGQSKLVAQWVMASHRAEMTQEELEKAQRLRRERVDMRRGSGRDGYGQGV